MILPRYVLAYENHSQTILYYVLAYENRSQTIPRYNLAKIFIRQGIVWRGRICVPVTQD